MDYRKRRSIKTMAELESRLRRTNQKQAALYLFCNFISLMLMTAYSGLMFSPTVQDIFPPGGDSRKQLYAIFVLALFGCVIFTIYAASLFFRKKSRQLGILMALGASRKTLAPGLFREVLLLSGSSAVLGTLAGFPFLFLLWTAFRIFIVNSEEMVLNVDFRCLWVSAGFTALVVICACVLAFLYMKRTNILDVIQEEHQNEPVKELGRWCGPVGIVLILAGAVAGYEGPTVYMNVFHRYPSPFLNLLYAPAFAGLYMVMLHTVVNGWTSRRKNPWKNIIARSMMKFQGKQTVNSLLVTTVLVAGGCFGIFYLPMLHTGLSMGSESRAYDYSWFWPSDQSLPSEEEIYSLAEKHDFQIKDWVQCSYLALACDNNMQILNPDNTLSYQHFDIADECHALSESTYNQITRQNISLDPGFFYAVTNEEETAYDTVENATLFTNMTTREELPVTCKGFVHFEDMASHGTAVLDDSDYEKISQGLAPEWTGSMIWFNSEGKDSYAFAQELFVKIVNSYDDQHFSNSYYDPVQYVMTEGYTNNYYGSSYTVSPEERQVDRTNINSSDFRMYWNYIPQFRIMDAQDQLKTFGVFMMTFLFIAIICITAALVIAYTRCQTIALNNAYVFSDLMRLGASPSFLGRELQRQAGPVFKIPAISGMSLMILLYFMILLANDGLLTKSEILGFAMCLEVAAVIALIIYAVFRRTLRSLRKQLGICSSEQ